MRRILSLFKTLLMLVPMTAVPVMAIFGIPQFFPVSASPSASTDQSSGSGGFFERRIGQSDALLFRPVSTNRASSIDVFQPYAAGAFAPGNAGADGGSDVVANAPSNELERRRLAWRDPLAGPAETHEVTLRSTSGASSRRGSRSSKISTASQRFDDADQFSSSSSFSGQAGIPPGRVETSAGISLTSGMDAGLDHSIASTLPTDPSPADSAAMTVPGRDRDGRNFRTTINDRSSSLAASTLPTEVLSWRDAVDRLNKLGIRTFRLTAAPGQRGYRFVCDVTSVDDPRISRPFEAESADPLVAVADVLTQVENWNLDR
ncbi:MAG: hypothetical protein HQ518_23615 [Rhodopirellula sp.]|nr:hypothetical protein [Rhodopirellula sp.]